MVKLKKTDRPFFWLFLMSGYVVLQFIWWGYLLVENQKTIMSLTGDYADDKIWRKLGMVLGEGSVFVALLIIGVFKIYKSINKELRLAKAQNNFILSITHELKSPMASVKLNLQTLLMRDLAKDKRDQLLNGALGELDRLDGLVSNILLSARIDNKAIQTVKEEFNPEEIIKNVIRDSSLTQNREVQLNLNMSHINSDKESFRIVVTNLIENAAKYSSSSDEIRVDLEEVSGRLKLQIHNEGVGISEKDINRVFEKFYRAQDEKTRSTKGTGLGLNIVHNLVKQLNGDVDVVSDRDWTTFTVILPKA